MADQVEEQQMVEILLLSPRYSTASDNLSTRSKFGITQSSMVAQSTLLSSPSLMIFGLILVAAFIAGVHHFLLAFLHERIVQDQFWMKNTSNTFSILVQTLSAASVSASLMQLIWWFLHCRSFTITQLNNLFSLPNSFPTVCLASSKMLWKIFPIVTMAALVQAYTLVSILAPNMLEGGTASPKMDNITVPTIFFGRDPQEHGWAFPAPPTYCNYQIATGFSRVLGSSLQSDILIGWSAPMGCENGCNYTIEYGAPALLCSDINAASIFDYANDTGSPFSPSAVLLNNSDFTTVYNGTYEFYNDGINVIVAWQRYYLNGDSIVGGVLCSLFNITQRSTVSFFNNTGVIVPRIISYNEPYKALIPQNVSSDCGGPHVPKTSFTQSYYLSYSALMEWLALRLRGTISYRSAQQWDFMSSVIDSSLFVVNETAVTFSPRGASVKTALEQVLVNLTVALIGAGREMTTVNATIMLNQLV
ncbi:uncharacterized protein EV420DRAFT_1734129 [Desarmillaria tabescens]|uniref:Uncharacterized protein n=1 Tax=Armillaria tabescens TaxID=1929756 RepID=A0AA39JAN5_ARMTA|nr:uncharacterized protein EV420DRAFT_1734129 [Desarmillaria tabescens]KAK0439281.1 hypothetical protein EV420DRAFT_1734129 [Desarmillaria tabescens]